MLATNRKDSSLTPRMVGPCRLTCLVSRWRAKCSTGPTCCILAAWCQEVKVTRRHGAAIAESIDHPGGMPRHGFTVIARSCRRGTGRAVFLAKQSPPHIFAEVASAKLRPRNDNGTDFAAALTSRAPSNVPACSTHSAHGRGTGGRGTRTPPGPYVCLRTLGFPKYLTEPRPETSMSSRSRAHTVALPAPRSWMRVR